MSDIQNELRRKGKIELGDQLLLYGGEWMLLKVGDTYIAHTPGEEPEMLTVRRLEVQKRRTGLTEGKVFPKERKKRLYNLHEVIKVTVMDNPKPTKEKQDGLVRDPETKPIVSRNKPTARANRPVPRDPGRAGRTNYSKPDRQHDSAGDVPESSDGGSGQGRRPGDSAG